MQIASWNYLEKLDSMPRSDWPVRHEKTNAASNGRVAGETDGELRAAYARAELQRRHEDDWMELSDRW